MHRLASSIRLCLRDDVAHERDDEQRLPGYSVGKLGVSVAARKTVVEEEMHFVKTFEDFIFGKDFFKTYEKIGEDASDNCGRKSKICGVIIWSSGYNTHQKDDSTCSIYRNIRHT